MTYRILHLNIIEQISNLKNYLRIEFFIKNKKKNIKNTKIELFLASEIRKPLPLIEEITKSSRSEATHLNKPNRLNEIDSEVQLSQIQPIEKN